jgi:hypothetical protein
MCETGRNIVNGFRELREFCNQVSLLFRTADGLMLQAEWRPIPRSSVVGSGSGAVDAPDWWLPFDLSRFYRHGDFPHLLPYIVVNLDDPEKENETEIDEALLSAGWLDYGVGKKCESWDYWYCRAHLYWESRDDSGKLTTLTNPKSWDFPSAITKVSTFAYPLQEITTPDMLNKRIVQRLLDEMRKAA